MDVSRVERTVVVARDKNPEPRELLHPLDRAARPFGDLGLRQTHQAQA